MARTVGEVAELAGVSVRTLHHYDEVGLVELSGRSEAGHRLYDDRDLERLQTVLFYRALGLSLERINEILGDPGFDRGAALREQRQLLLAELDRLTTMLAAVETAIDAHDEGRAMSHEAMFEVFGVDHQQEAEERWGETAAWAESRARTADLTKDDWAAIKAEGEQIDRRYAEAMAAGEPPGGPTAMDAAEAHRQHIGRHFYDCAPELHRGLGEMYVADPRFAQHYDRIAEGLAAYVRDAIAANADRHAR